MERFARHLSRSRRTPRSSDHATWKQDADPIITRRSFPWATVEVRSPTALCEGATIRLWIAGNNRPQDFLPEVRSQHRTRQFGIGSMTFAGGRAHTNAPP
jgi:hypothetical protein